PRRAARRLPSARPECGFLSLACPPASAAGQRPRFAATTAPRADLSTYGPSSGSRAEVDNIRSRRIHDVPDAPGPALHRLAPLLEVFVPVVDAGHPHHAARAVVEQLGDDGMRDPELGEARRRGAAQIVQ